MKEVSREIYLEKMIDAQDNGLVKIIAGIRRCGKSYLLFTLFQGYLLTHGVDTEHIIAIALDSLDSKKLRDADTLYQFIKSRITDNKKYFVLLDEIQIVPNFEEVLNSLSHYHNVDMYVTGSNSRFLSKDIITEFRGRGDVIRLHPFSFSEFVSIWDGTEEDAWDDYFNYGGMPLVVAMKNPERKAEYLQQAFQQIYLTDIMERHKIRHPQEMDELLDILASSVGSLTNPEKLSDTFRSVKKEIISPKTLNSYIQRFEDAFLIESAKRYDIKGKKYIKTPKKYYFEDVGLRNARLGFRQQEENHIMENIIFNELQIRGYSVDIGVVPIQTMDSNGVHRQQQVEIDFIAYKGNKKFYIQSAFSIPDAEKMVQEKRPLLRVSDSFNKVIVVKDNMNVRRDENGIATIGIRKFLLNKDSLDC